MYQDLFNITRHGQHLGSSSGVHLDLKSELQITYVKLTSIDTTCAISSPNSMFDHLLESSNRDDSNKWYNIGFSEEMGIIEIKVCTL